jgi:tetratricopeptide (TPR) repeat protein
MFFIIPLTIFAVSMGLGIWLVTRKFVYLKKLTPEAIAPDTLTTQNGFWTEFFPEFNSWTKKINLQEYKINFLAEFEKFLRKFRLLFLKIETLNSKLIHKVRKTTIEQGEAMEALNEKTIEEAQQLAIIKTKAEEKKDEERDLKEKEQKLIIEIAKDPKNAELYKGLGRLYVKTRNWEDAYESFKKAVELSPEDAGANQELDKVSKRIKKVGENQSVGEFTIPKPKA